MDNYSLVISELTNLLGVNFASPDGYWLVNGLSPEGHDLATTDFVDFFEPVHQPGHKKSFLTEEGTLKKKGNSSILHGQEETLMPLYKGLMLTPRIIGQGFFMYSSGVVHWHLHAARLGRTYQCGATLNQILSSEDVPQDEKEKMINRSLALGMVAFTVYEGAGALGGYNAQQWEFWARIWGIETPLKMGKYFVDAQEAAECYALFKNTKEEVEQKRLFKKWWLMGYPGMEKVVETMWTYFKWVSLYGKFEGGSEAPDPKSPNHRGATWAGFFRRASKGLLINKGVALKDVYGKSSNWGPVPLGDHISQDQDIYMKDFIGQGGVLTPFGQWLELQYQASQDRGILVETLARMEVMRDEDPQAKDDKGVKNLSQRGKVRFHSLKRKG